ncbi:MAG: sigma factor-like helix-turn-helix DNA-binding protein [Pseudomonadota bacterium]
MSKIRQTAHEAVQARLSRFAHCVAPSDRSFVDLIERVVGDCFVESDGFAREAYRHLLHAIGRSQGEFGARHIRAPLSVVARFSILPYHQRVAFALVVIEEFSLADTADIMELDVHNVRALLSATRDGLFAAQVMAANDA